MEATGAGTCIGTCERASGKIGNNSTAAARFQIGETSDDESSAGRARRGPNAGEKAK